MGKRPSDEEIRPEKRARLHTDSGEQSLLPTWPVCKGDNLSQHTAAVSWLDSFDGSEHLHKGHALRGVEDQDLLSLQETISDIAEQATSSSAYHAVRPWNTCFPAPESLPRVLLHYNASSLQQLYSETTSETANQSGSTLKLTVPSDTDPADALHSDVSVTEPLYHKFDSPSASECDLVGVGQKHASGEGSEKSQGWSAQNSAHVGSSSGSSSPPTDVEFVDLDETAEDSDDDQSDTGRISIMSDTSALENQKCPRLLLSFEKASENGGSTRKPFKGRLDTGASRCLVSEDIVERFGLTDSMRDCCRVFNTADGREFRSTRCIDLVFKILDLDKFCKATFYMLPNHLCSFDVILCEKMIMRWDLIRVAERSKRSLPQRTVRPGV